MRFRLRRWFSSPIDWGPGEILLIALAGLAGGAINTVVGSGTLIPFPVLLAFGYPAGTPTSPNCGTTEAPMERLLWLVPV